VRAADQDALALRGLLDEVPGPELHRSTAVLPFPWPDRITTGGAPSRSRAAQDLEPVHLRHLTSRKRVGRLLSAIFSPTGPFAARQHSYPSYSKIIFREERTAVLVAMMRTLASRRFSTSTRVRKDVR